MWGGIANSNIRHCFLNITELCLWQFRNFVEYCYSSYDVLLTFSSYNWRRNQPETSNDTKVTGHSEVRCIQLRSFHSCMPKSVKSHHQLPGFTLISHFWISNPRLTSSTLRLTSSLSVEIKGSRIEPMIPTLETKLL